MKKPDRTAARVRRNLTRHDSTPAQLDKAAKITPDDIAHADDTLRAHGPRSLVDKFDCPEYEGDGLPSDTSRDP